MKGIDVSAYQGTVPWHSLTDISFGLTKVTEGEGYVNPYWHQNAIMMKQEKKIRGFYGFSLPGLEGNTPEAEAAYLWGKIEHIIEKGDLLAWDIEKTYTGPWFTCDWTFRALTHLERLCKFKPLIYSYPDFIKTTLTDTRLARWPLWLAWYDDNLPRGFQQWSSIALWQRGPGTVKNEPGQVDIDIFFLDANHLEAYGKPH